MRFGILKLQNRDTQNGVTFWVTNFEIFTEVLLSSLLTWLCKT